MRNFLRYRVGGHALFITAVVAVVVSILCLMMVLLFYHRLRGETSYNAGVKLRRDLQSAMSLVLADTTIIAGERDDSMDLFGKNDDSVFIKRSNWGLCEVASITVAEQGRRLGRSFFYGAAPDGFLDGCLYLTDHRSPLSLSGDARLEGDGYLPKGGARPVFVDGRAFAFNEMIRGSVKISDDSLPAVDRRLVRQLEGWFGPAGLGDSRGSVGLGGSAGLAGPAGLAGGIGSRDWAGVETGIPDSLEAPFSDTMVVLYQRGPVALLHGRLSGHILIVSDTAIRVGRDCLLEDAVLAAPSIEFESGFSGRLQAVATDSIVVRKGCTFSYPSALVVIKRDSSLVQPGIAVGDSCAFAGAVVTVVEKKDENKTFVRIGKNSAVTGLVYCAGYLSLEGNVKGVVLTDYFLYRTGASIYINYLVDVAIDRRALSRYYVVPHFFANGEGNMIMQWVN